MSAAKDSIAGIIVLPSSVADRTTNIEKTCEFLKEKGVILPPDIVKGKCILCVLLLINYTIPWLVFVCKCSRVVIYSYIYVV